MKRRARIVRVAVRRAGGLRFLANGEGHYLSEDGHFGLFHVMRGTPHVFWELWTLKDGDDMDAYVHGEAWLSLLVHAINQEKLLEKAP